MLFGQRQEAFSLTRKEEFSQKLKNARRLSSVQRSPVDAHANDISLNTAPIVFTNNQSVSKIQELGQRFSRFFETQSQENPLFLKLKEAMRFVQRLRQPEGIDQEQTELTPDIQQLKQEMNELQRKYIQLQVKLFDFLDQHTYESQEQVLAIFENDNLNEQETELVKRFCENLERRRKRTQQVLTRFRKIASASLSEEDRNFQYDVDCEAGKNLFSCLVGHEPIGVVELLDLGHACALRITNQADFQLLDDRSNIGGFYNKDVKLKTGLIRYRVNTFRGFPFVALAPGAEHVVLNHEKNHGWNRITFDALSDISPDIEQEVWGGHSLEKNYSPLVRESKRKVDDILDQITQATENSERVLAKPFDIEDITKQLEEATEDFLPYAFARAKDEVLADFVASGSFGHVYNLYHFTFSKSKDDQSGQTFKHYQFLREIGLLGKKFNVNDDLRSVYSTVIDKYNNTLKQNTNYMEKLFKVLGRFPELQNRKKELIAFMRQNPIDTWESRGRRLFRDEFDSLSRINQEYQSLESSLINHRNSFLSLIHETELLTISDDDENLKKEKQLLLSLLSKYEKYLKQTLELYSERSASGFSTNEKKRHQKILSTIEERKQSYLQKFQELQTQVQQQLEAKITNHPIEQYINQEKEKTLYIQKAFQEAFGKLYKNRLEEVENINQQFEIILTGLSNDKKLRGFQKTEIRKLTEDVVFGSDWDKDIMNWESAIQKYNLDSSTIDQFKAHLAQIKPSVESFSQVYTELNTLSEYYLQLRRLYDQVQTARPEIRPYENPFTNKKLEWLNEVQTRLGEEGIRKLHDFMNVDTELPQKIATILTKVSENNSQPNYTAT